MAEIAVVGLGASAGGLEAFSRLLRFLPADTGYAFVLVQHLDATHPSRLSEILARTTTMPVGEASDGVRVTPNRIFVIPPNTELTLKDRILTVRPRPQLAAPHMPIDRFLISLADDCGSRAVGVVLSGAGSDGANGMMAIKEAGGVTFAQEPSTAEFPSMPTMAAFAGCVDVVLPPEGIAAELVRLARHSHFSGPRSDDEPRPLAPGAEAGDLRSICELMHESTGIDFSLYRETTVNRRVLRRVALRGVESLRDYARLLASEPSERHALQFDLLIGVTSFFRDPAAFEAVKALVFPAIVRERTADRPIRIWVPGCASGEEAYSILIALQEFQRDRDSAFRVQMFASDISESALERARAGLYPENVAVDVSPERLRRHFTKVGTRYQISKSLREQCVFSRHNLLDDPPFSKLDFISCRNVLIYLDAVQKQIIPLFHYALEEHGCLMLGKSETAHFSDLFTPIEPRLRIFSKRRVARRPYGFLGRSPVRRSRGGESTAADETSLTVRRTGDVSRDADRVLLSRYSPAGVLVDENLDVLEIRGRPVPFLALTPGKLSYHLLKLIPDTGLFLEVEKLIHEASATGEPVSRHHVPYASDGRIDEVDIEVTPITDKRQCVYLVLFEPSASEAAAVRSADKAVLDADAGTAARDRRIKQLSSQLAAARRRLESMIEEHETSAQENQQVTEDALSANEELQSLSEELETAKEELESTNEELITVNRDLESRNTALAAAGDLARAIVETVLVPLVVVDRDLIVQHVNASFGKAFHVSVGGIERKPLESACDGAWNVPELRSLLTSVFTERKSFDHFELTQSFLHAGRRVLMLSGRRIDQLDLALLTVEDVTEFREAERALRTVEKQRQQAEKLEVVGRLAGGIAHDFNNLFTVIISDCDLVVEMLQDAHPAIEHVEEIGRSAERAAALTDQLLSFSRRKVLQPKVFDLNPVVLEFESMLRRVLGEHIEIVVRCAPDSYPVRADAGEIGRVLMNLCLNARDAMPTGGTLTLTTSNELLDEAAARQRSLAAGRYVRLCVRDTGTGMNTTLQAHLFEPFFSTKEPNRGHGLGLSTVLGIVQQSGGAISCESKSGEGTEFTILLPVGDVAALADASVARRVASLVGGSEVILLAEDDPQVRRVTRRILERAGYRVLEASAGLEALALLESDGATIDALVTDMVMPGMSGRELAEKALAMFPGLRVLFVSGYTEDDVIVGGRGVRARFLQKPFTPAALTQTVRLLFDAKSGSTD